MSSEDSVRTVDGILLYLFVAPQAPWCPTSGFYQFREQSWSCPQSIMSSKCRTTSSSRDLDCYQEGDTEMCIVTSKFSASCRTSIQEEEINPGRTNALLPVTMLRFKPSPAVEISWWRPKRAPFGPYKTRYVYITAYTGGRILQYSSASGLEK